MQTKKAEVWVGLFMLIALCAAIFLCLQVANVKSLGSAPTYRLYATFDNVGGLKARSPVKIGGVVIGRVAEISLIHRPICRGWRWTLTGVTTIFPIPAPGDPDLRLAGRAVSGPQRRV